MSEQTKNIFDQLLDQIRAVVAEEIAKALNERRPAKLQFSTAEAAEMLNVPASWLAAKARAGEIPHQQMGHYRVFSLRDIEKIMTQYSVESGSIPMIYSGHDGQDIQADSNAARAESVPVGEAPRSMAEYGGAVGSRGKADTDHGGTRNESFARKKRERRET